MLKYLAALIEFIAKQDPAFPAAIQGISRAEIELCEEGCAVKLPELYIEFLTLMGADSGSFLPFGGGYDYNFYELVELLPAEDYPPQKYFKVARAVDPTETSSYDLFLDLGRSDGVDAALVLFEVAGPFREDQVIEVGFTLGEYLTKGAFGAFELRQRAHQTTLLARGFPPQETRRRKSAALQLLTNMRCSLAMPEWPRLACCTRKDLSVLVEAREDLSQLALRVGGDDSLTVQVAVDQILVGVPDAVPRDSLGPRT